MTENAVASLLWFALGKMTTSIGSPAATSRASNVRCAVDWKAVEWKAFVSSETQALSTTWSATFKHTQTPSPFTSSVLLVTSRATTEAE